MGLDIALGLMVLMGAIRGWFRGFLLQAIRLGGLIGCIYAAAPTRDFARPYVVPYLASIRPDLLDRMLWWASAAACYIATVGLAGMAVRMNRRRPYGEPEPDRFDQFGGFLLAAAKGAVMVAFLLAGLDKYALAWARKIPWADEQVRTSQVLAWNDRYRPADRIWSSPPVQHLVAHVRQMGLGNSAEVERARSHAESALHAHAASARAPRLDLPTTPDPSSADFVAKIDRAMKVIEAASPHHP